MLFISLKPNSEAGADDMAGEWKHEQTESLFSPECVNGNISMLSFPAFERLQKGHCSLYKIKADKVWCCVLSLAIFNTYILVFLLQLYIYLSSFSFFIFYKNADVAHKVCAKESWIYRSLSGGHWWRWYREGQSTHNPSKAAFARIPRNAGQHYLPHVSS